MDPGSTRQQYYIMHNSINYFSTKSIQIQSNVVEVIGEA